VNFMAVHGHRGKTNQEPNAQRHDVAVEGSLNCPCEFIMFSLLEYRKNLQRPARRPRPRNCFPERDIRPRRPRNMIQIRSRVNKLVLKCSLTKKCLCHSNLRADFKLEFCAVCCATIFHLGKGMPGVAPPGLAYRFGPFELDTGEESLARSGTRVKVQDLPYRLLVLLW